jgi:hypothetical protein
MDVIFKDAIGQEIHAASALSPLAGITATLPKPMTSGAKAEGRFGKQDFVYCRPERALLGRVVWRRPCAGSGRRAMW